MAEFLREDILIVSDRPKDQLEIIEIEGAKPGIPVENPQRRAVPDSPDPMPQRVPTPATEPNKQPIQVPSEPVPAHRWPYLYESRELTKKHKTGTLGNSTSLWLHIRRQTHCFCDEQ